MYFVLPCLSCFGWISTFGVISTLNTCSCLVWMDLNNVPLYIHFSLIVFPYLSLHYLSPSHLSPFPPLPPSIFPSAEWIVEMDVMRQVYAAREMEAGPWRSTDINKVKNNQVRVDCGSPRPCCSHGHGRRQSHATIDLSLLQKWLFYLLPALISSRTIQLFYLVELIMLLICFQAISHQLTLRSLQGPTSIIVTWWWFYFQMFFAWK